MTHPPAARSPWARLDDVVSGRALLFETPDRVLRATCLDDVAATLRAVDDATAAGSWAVGFVSYDATPAFLPAAPSSRRIDSGMPLAWFALCDEPAEVPALQGIPASDGSGPATEWPWTMDWSEAEHAQAVAQVQERITAGDTYQANLTTTLRGRLRRDPLQWYRDLVVGQHAAFNAYLDTGHEIIASASPERFFRWSPDELTCSPMKGTRPRGRTSAEDERLRVDLLTSDKDRAENVMIVDLLRNDLAKVAVAGSVRVTDLLRAEAYPSVWQLTSDVRATPVPNLTLTQVMEALFPCGSITGAPKVSTAQILDQLEPLRRGIYCGAIGYVAPPDADHPFRAEFNVAIRTAHIEPMPDRDEPLRGRPVTYGVGSGITISSRAGEEFAELEAKTALVRTPPPAPFHLLETFRSDASERTRERHLTRMLDSAAYFGFGFDRDRIRSDVALALEGARPQRARVLLDRAGTAEVHLSPLPEPSTAPVRLVIDTDHPVDPTSVWLRHKTTHRHAYDQARARHPDADDVVLVNTLGHVTESTIATLVVLLDGQWCTPPLSDGCLPGVARAVLLGDGAAVERSMSIADLRGAERVDVVSSLRGRRPAHLVD